MPRNQTNKRALYRLSFNSSVGPTQPTYKLFLQDAGKTSGTIFLLEIDTSSQPPRNRCLYPKNGMLSRSGSYIEGRDVPLGNVPEYSQTFRRITAICMGTEGGEDWAANVVSKKRSDELFV